MFQDVVTTPPFNISRASHVVLGVSDLKASKSFYVDVLGLVVTDETAETVWLRGLEESCHHSLTLHRSDDPTCHRLGMRVLTEADLDAAGDYFLERGVAAKFVDVPHQGRTLHLNDSIGTPLEFCATMDAAPRLQGRYDRYVGGCVQRMDHYQVAAYDVSAAHRFYQPLGFRCSEYTYSATSDGGIETWGVWLQRKGNPHDIVFTNGVGPRLHHFAYTIRDAHDLIHLCDVAGARGFGSHLERGPGRHGMGGGALFVYFLDPDGHRVELFNTHYQAIDIEEPIAWNLADPRRADLWGLPARKRWFVEASRFEGVRPKAPRLHAEPPTLERMLSL